MKWIKGFLIFGMVLLAHSTVSINDVEAATKTKTEKAGKKVKPAAKKAKAAKAAPAKKAKAEAPKKSSLFSSFTAGLKKVGGKIKAGAKAVGGKIKAGAKAAGSKIASGAKAVKGKAGNAIACRSGKGEVPGQKLYAMAASGTQLTDAHVVASHTAAAPQKGRKK